jgi:hypothetical protein
MRTHFTFILGLSAFVLLQSTPAQAQRQGNMGQQIQRQFVNNLTNSLTGQPNYPYQYQGYNGYQVQPWGYGRPGYQQPMPNSYPQYQPYQQSPLNTYSQRMLDTRVQQQNYVPQQTVQTQRYQLPAQYNGTAQGTVVSYGGANYIVNADGTMSPWNQAQPATAAVQRYQIPAQYNGTAPGSVISYGDRSYIINQDQTMSPH